MVDRGQRRPTLFEEGTGPGAAGRRQPTGRKKDLPGNRPVMS
ncbi:hypothetical protein HMPREF9056_00527 [Actinomyces sp. oral taxon 170 str. F0386]|nr:hypothetical protein HMPREF9056_00527 [Actinomyces sp. oral taxon 170 str. F0386]